MADPAKPKTAKAKPASAVHKRHTLEHRSFDIMPKHKTQASATSRPVVTGNKPQHRDSTLTSKHEAPGAHLSRHKATLHPLSASAKPAAPAPVAAPAATPASTPSATPAAPATAAVPATPVVHAAVPAFPDLQPTAALPPSPVPEVAAPVRETPVPDELALADLPGLHQDEEAVQATAPVAPAGAPAAPAVPAAHPVTQTAEQARELADALRDLKTHPAVPASDAPVVVVHQHDYLHMILLFLGFAIIGIAVVLVAFDLLIDAGIIQVPFEVPTNFFN